MVFLDADGGGCAAGEMGAILHVHCPNFLIGPFSWSVRAPELRVNSTDDLREARIQSSPLRQMLRIGAVGGDVRVLQRASLTSDVISKSTTGSSGNEPMSRFGRSLRPWGSASMAQPPIRSASPLPSSQPRASERPFGSPIHEPMRSSARSTGCCGKGATSSSERRDSRSRRATINRATRQVDNTRSFWKASSLGNHDLKHLEVFVTVSGEDSGEVALTTAVSEIYVASTARASALGGGSLSSEGHREPDESERDLDAWYPQLSPTIKRLNRALRVSAIPQVGPLNTGSITFNNGVPVGGFSQLTLFQSGNFNFNGHFHVSGAPSYNVAFAVGVRSQRGVLYTFLRSGHLAGTFEPGSRNYDWSVQESRDVIREDWPNISVNSTWWWNAQVNWDPLALVSTIKTLAETVGSVASVVALL